MDSVSNRLENEIIERKVEDEKLRLEISKNWDNNATDHQRLSESLVLIADSINKLDATMSFHTGYHEGKGR